MAILTCKMCGGTLIVEPGTTVAECDSCGLRQTIPSADSEKKIALFNQADKLRRQMYFDRAASVYEMIVAEFPEEAEAYWGLVLCDYGIEYVKDPATGENIPTCHRFSYDSVLADPNVEKALEWADVVARKVYKAEAQRLEDIRKGIVEIIGKKEPYDIFICYKETDENTQERTNDSVEAYEVYEDLVEKGYRVFFSRITMEEHKGEAYEPIIFAALNSAKVMLVFGSKVEYVNAPWVRNEWTRYLKIMAKDKSRQMIPCYWGNPYLILPPEIQDIQGNDMGKIGARQDLVRGIEKILPREKEKEPVRQVVQQVVQGGGPNVTALLKRGKLALEDNTWDDAENYYDQVLNMDAECGEAYLGKALIEWRLSGLKALSQKFAPEKYKPNSTVCSAGKKDDVAEERLRKEYAVEGYLSSDDIAASLGYSFSYNSYTAGWKRIKTEAQNTLKASRNLTRAENYATSELKSQIRATLTGIYGKLDEKIESADRSDRDTAEKLRKGYENHLQTVEEKLKERKVKAEETRENEYQKTISRVESAGDSESTYSQCKSTLEKFGLRNYKDSKVYIDKCNENIARIREENRIKQEKQKAQALYKQEESIDKGKVVTGITLCIIAVVLLIGLALLVVNCGQWVEEVLVPSAGFSTYAEDSGPGEVAFVISCVLAVIIGLIVGFCGGGIIGGFIALIVGFLVVRAVVALLAHLVGWVVNPIALLVVGGIFAFVILCTGFSLKHKKNWFKILIELLLIVAATFASYSYVSSQTAGRLEQAQALVAEGRYAEAIPLLEKLGNYKNAKELLMQTYYSYAGELETPAQQAMMYGKAIGYQDAREKSFALWNEVANREVADLNGYFAGIRNDGTVFAADSYSDPEDVVADWTDIVDVVAMRYSIVGLKSDGTVLIYNGNSDWDEDVLEWTDIVDLAGMQEDGVVGLKIDGTVVVAGDVDGNVDEWTDIVDIEMSGSGVVGLKADGTVISTVASESTSTWTDIKEIFVFDNVVMGIKTDTTLVCSHDEFNAVVAEWWDIIHVTVDNGKIAAVQSGGDVYTYEYNDTNYHQMGELHNIGAVYAYDDKFYAQRKDGTFFDVQSHYNDLSDWTNIKLPN